MAGDLSALAHRVGYTAPPPVPEAAPQHPFALSQVYDAEVETRARAAYRRDYWQFGFGDWA
jgi:hypothetical protein